MSDRSPVQLYVYAAPESERAAIMEVIDDEGMSVDYGLRSAEGPLELGAQYLDDEGSLDAYELIANDLIAALEATQRAVPA